MISKLFVLLASVALLALSPATEAGSKTKKIFNGKNLKGWQVPEGNLWWSVEDGVLTAKSDPAKTGSILWTEMSYRDFVIELEFKMGEGNVDSGVFLRSEDKPQPQIQIGISGSLQRDMTCSPYVPGSSYPVEAHDIPELLKPTDWNQMRIQAVGNDYTVWLNGKEVMEYHVDSPDAVAEGPIGLQLHPGRDMTIDFRNIRLGEIK